MSQKSIQVGLIGLGTIGVGVAKILLQNSRNLQARAQIPVVLKAACDLDITKDRGVDLSTVTLTTDATELLKDPEIDVIIEVIGGVNPARTFITQALKAGKHVITSNKEVIAKHGKEFLGIARENNVNLYYEAAVGGGIPILHGLKNSLSANNIEEVFGIVNGTTNYILTKMTEEGAEFSAVLKEAQALGYAEADPTSDVDGYDVAYKLSILAGIAFNSHFSYEDIHFEGIRDITPQDIAMADNMGYVIKLVAIGIARSEDAVELRVHPVMIEKKHPLAAVNGAFNAVFVRGNYVNDTMFYGPGAGELPTASAVVGDLMDIAMAPDQGRSHPSISTDFCEKRVIPMGETTSAYFLSLIVRDEPGVLAAITRICAEHSASICKIDQDDATGGEAGLIMVTHEVRESDMQAAVAHIKELKTVLNVNNLIRVGL
ncbi:MAG: homoserine dehydrogenase [Opitutales bacterium]|nr:homoserine dehydrogenase [Opitutales bacterium]